VKEFGEDKQSMKVL
jgi:hypothetical protein